MRFSPRLAVRIPAEIKIGPAKIDILIVSIGLDGAFIRNSAPGSLNPSQNGLLVRYDLPQQGTSNTGSGSPEKTRRVWPWRFRTWTRPPGSGCGSTSPTILFRGGMPFLRPPVFGPAACMRQLRLGPRVRQAGTISSIAKGWRWSKVLKAGQRT